MSTSNLPAESAASVAVTVPSHGVSPPTCDASVIIPTYGEAANLEALIPQVHGVLLEAGLAGEIVVVDDHSRDGTVEVCTRLGKHHPVRLFVRTEERGLSSAVIHGMRRANGRVLVVMDADHSHPPEKLPELIAAVAEGGAEFVIGSRYVAGGKTDDQWGLSRWLNSKIATWLARPLTRARDPMAGFFALARTSFEAADGLDPIGYKIGLELIVKCDCRDVREVPIYFRDRLYGESKLTLAEQLNYLRHLGRLYQYRLGRMVRPLKFLAVGASGMAVDFAVFALMLSVVPVEAARALAIWSAMSWNFGGNRIFTFRDRRRDGWLKQYGLFCGACLVGALINWSLSISLMWSSDFFAVHKFLAAFCGIVAGTAFNYALSNKLVFRRQPTPPQDEA